MVNRADEIVVYRSNWCQELLAWLRGSTPRYSTGHTMTDTKCLTILQDVEQIFAISPETTIPVPLGSIIEVREYNKYELKGAWWHGTSRLVILTKKAECPAIVTENLLYARSEPPVHSSALTYGVDDNGGRLERLAISDMSPKTGKMRTRYVDMVPQPRPEYNFQGIGMARSWTAPVRHTADVADDVINEVCA